MLDLVVVFALFVFMFVVLLCFCVAAVFQGINICKHGAHRLLLLFHCSLLAMPVHEPGSPGLTVSHSELGFVELCPKIVQIMRNDFKDYARTFCQLFLPLFAKNLYRFCITHRRIQDRPILCLWGRQNSLPPSSKTSDFLYCLARSAALTLAES